jgi:hypothetical protein
MQANHAAQAHRGLVWHRPLIPWITLALLVVTATITVLLLVANPPDQAQPTPTGPQPTQPSGPARQVPRLGHPVAE